MIIHFIHHPVSAKRLVEPLVVALDSAGMDVELWIENRKGLAKFVESIECPKRLRAFDLSFNPFLVAVRVAKLVKDFLSLKPAAVHANQARAAFIPLLSAWIAGVPIRIYHNRGTPYLGYSGVLRALLWLLEVLNCRLATHVITVSHSIRRRMIQNGIVPEAKCEVLGEGSSCGIDLSQFSIEQFDQRHRAEARQQLGLSSDAYVALYVGRPVRRKGFHVLLHAWRHLASDDDGQVLLLAGCTCEDVERAVGAIPRNVVALGYVQDLRPCYAACDVVVLPSWHEGLPYALLEGAAAGRALIGSDVPGIDSIVLKDRNGLLVPPEDMRGLADALVALRNDPQGRRSMGAYGRRLVESSFDRRVFNRLLLAYYHRIGLGDSQSPAPSALKEVPS